MSSIQKSHFFLGLTILFLLFLQCVKMDDAAKEMLPVFQSVQSLSAFYKEYKRLPKDNSELGQYAAKNNIALDLAKFKTMNYSQKTDSVFTIEYEMAPPSEIKGTFEFRIK
jgi:hypothetical protein